MRYCFRYIWLTNVENFKTLRQAVLELCRKKGNFFTCFSVTFCFSLSHVIEIFHLYLFYCYSLCFVCWITMSGKHEHRKLKVNIVVVPENAYIPQSDQNVASVTLSIFVYEIAKIVWSTHKVIRFQCSVIIHTLLAFVWPINDTPFLLFSRCLRHIFLRKKKLSQALCFGFHENLLCFEMTLTIIFVSEVTWC